MNKKIYKLIYLLSFIFYSPITFSQTTTIDYLMSSLSTTACNVFGPTAVSVNSVSHSSFAGGVMFNSTDGILLGTKANSPIGGTAYIINYSFSLVIIMIYQSQLRVIQQLT